MVSRNGYTPVLEGVPSEFETPGAHAAIFQARHGRLGSRLVTGALAGGLHALAPGILGAVLDRPEQFNGAKPAVDRFGVAAAGAPCSRAGWP